MCSMAVRSSLPSSPTHCAPAAPRFSRAQAALFTGRGSWMRGRSRRGGGGGVGAVAKGRERGGCGRCCNAVNGRMGVVELHERHRVRHSRRSMPLACACTPCPRHRGRVQLEVRACAAARCSDTRGGSCLWRMCAPQGAPCRRAGGRAVRKARSGSTQPSRRSAPCYVLCCRAARIRSLATTTEAVGKLLGFRHTARRRLRRAGLWRSREPGVAGAGCDGAESAADAVSAPPSGTCEVVGRGHGQRTRERRWRRGCRPFSTGTNYSEVSYLATFYVTPRLPRG